MNQTPLKLRSFESKILYFNGMYQLPIAAYPSTTAVVIYQKDMWQKKHGITLATEDTIKDRLEEFKLVLQDELNEVNDITEALNKGVYKEEMDFLTDMADWLGDIIIYCASEMTRYGIPIGKTLSIIMDSNFSKLGADGKPIIKGGKVQKGPFYWKPEPALKKMLEEEVKEFTTATKGGIENA